MTGLEVDIRTDKTPDGIAELSGARCFQMRYQINSCSNVPENEELFSRTRCATKSAIEGFECFDLRLLGQRMKRMQASGRSKPKIDLRLTLAERLTS